MESIITIGNTKIWTIKDGNGIPCILCNGGPGCDDYLEPISYMIRDLCEVVRFEPRGCGRSDYDGNYELERTIEDIEEIRIHYGFEKMLIGGHSAGPDIALAYTIKYSERVIGLFGISGGRIVNDREWSATYKSNLEKIGEDLGGKIFQADIMVNKVGNASWRKYIKRENLLSDISRIDIPAIFINAENDIRPNWPTKQIAALIPRGEYREIKNAAHMIWLTHYHELENELRTFIKMVEAEQRH